MTFEESTEFTEQVMSFLTKVTDKVPRNKKLELKVTFTIIEKNGWKSIILEKGTINDKAEKK